MKLRIWTPTRRELRGHERRANEARRKMVKRLIASGAIK